MKGILELKLDSTERSSVSLPELNASPFWAQKGTFFKCSDKDESFYLQKVCFSDREKFSEPYRLHPKIGKTQHNAFLKLNASLPKGRSAGRSTDRVGKLNTTLSYGSRCGV
ncbi:hypothetical protein LEP1GSC080_0169 [Leptospira interrogans str. FPW2026]|nr:hypothetical protein LEP1GSC080_0169 [Leptospira interrogans str. FPW2026]